MCYLNMNMFICISVGTSIVILHLAFDYSSGNVYYTFSDQSQFFGGGGVGLFNREKGIHRVIGSGLDNPTGLAVAPADG